MDEKHKHNPWPVIFVCSADPPGVQGHDRDVAPTAGVAPSPDAPDFVVEDLRDKLKAAAVRERQLHQHLLFHMQGVFLCVLLAVIQTCVPPYSSSQPSA